MNLSQFHPAFFLAVSLRFTRVVFYCYFCLFQLEVLRDTCPQNFCDHSLSLLILVFFEFSSLTLLGYVSCSYERISGFLNYLSFE